VVGCLINWIRYGRKQACIKRGTNSTFAWSDRKFIRQDSLWPGRYSNRAPTEYKSIALSLDQSVRSEMLLFRGNDYNISLITPMERKKYYPDVSQLCSLIQVLGFFWRCPSRCLRLVIRQRFPHFLLLDVSASPSLFTTPVGNTTHSLEWSWPSQSFRMKEFTSFYCAWVYKHLGGDFPA
jgi:hypothetical protein